MMDGEMRIERADAQNAPRLKCRRIPELVNYLKSCWPNSRDGAWRGLGDDLGFEGEFAEDDRKGIAIQHRPLRPLKVWRKESWLLMHPVDDREEFFVEAIRCSRTSHRVPVVCFVDLFTGFRVIGQRFQTRNRALASGESRAFILS